LIFYRLEWGIYLFISIIPFTSLLPTTPIPGLNGTTIIIILFFLRSISTKESLMKVKEIPSLDFPIFALFTLTFFSIILSTLLFEYQILPLKDYFTKLYRWFLFIFLYFIFRRELNSKNKIILALGALSLGLFLEGAFVFKAVTLSGRLRAYGTIGQSNELSQFFSSYLIVPLALLLYEKKNTVNLSAPRVQGVKGFKSTTKYCDSSFFLKIFYSSALLLSLYGVVVSLSRGGFLSTFMVFAIYLLAKSKKTFIILLLLILGFSGTFYTLLPEKVINRINETFVEEEVTDEITLERSALSRVPLAKAGIEMFKESPLFGKGFMSYPILVPQYKYGGQFGIERPKASHNMHIRILSELGILGYIFFFLIFYNSIKIGFFLYKRSTIKFNKEIGVVVICSAISFLVGCLFGDRFFRGTLITYFFLLSAISYNLYRIEFFSSDDK